MKKLFLLLTVSLFMSATFAQTGHMMQGIGAFNMSMGGAATGHSLDINGALQWNSAAISKFDKTIITLDVGLMFSSPTLYSTVPTPNGPMSGSTESELGPSPLPSLAIVFGKEDSKHTFGVSIFGVSGFGVDFPQSSTNPINFPQNQGGFGHVKSSYMLMQVGLTYAYEISDKLSVGVEPIFNYEILQIEPNPLTSPSMQLGYPNSESAGATGFGGQIGLYYGGDDGFKAGISYKTEQFFGEYTFTNTYLDGTSAPDNSFTMNFPAIFSVGAGYSKELFDIAIDYRRVFYSSTEGFEASGWTIAANGMPDGSVAGFGWQDINVISAGVQLKLIEFMPIRLGYTYSSNPIDPDLTMYSISAPAIIEQAFQIGLGLNISDRLVINATYHHGMSNDKTSGKLLNPMMISPTNPRGEILGSEVAFDMTTNLFILGASYSF